MRRWAEVPRFSLEPKQAEVQGLQHNFVVRPFSIEQYVLDQELRLSRELS